MPTLTFIERASGAELTDAQFRRAVRERASLGDPIAPDACDALGYDLITTADLPAHDTARKKAVPGPLMPAEGGGYTRGWELVDLSPAELDAQAQAYAEDLERVRRAHLTTINQARERADSSHFEIGGKRIAVDDASMRRIAAITGHVALFGAYPDGWAGGWRAMDNTMHPLPDVDAWRAFIAAMTAQGVANFARQQALKARIEAATTRTAILAVQWE